MKSGMRLAGVPKSFASSLSVCVHPASCKLLRERIALDYQSRFT
ncbi:hypothetical protein [Undibacterium sp. TJN19]